MKQTKRKRRAALAMPVAMAVILGMAVLTTPAEARGPIISLNSVGSRDVGDTFPLKGNVRSAGAGRNKTVWLQRKTANGWATRDRLFRMGNGAYSFGRRSFARPQKVSYRTVARRNGKTIDVSPTLTVTIKAGPGDPSGTSLYPDLGVKKLDVCSPAERTLAANCFRIVNAGGKRLLKFPAVTLNIGDGPLEINAKRSSTTSTNWRASQVIHNTSGGARKRSVPAAEFYYAMDGHSHWHIRDFDAYEIQAAAGPVVRGEKHGFCFEDNSTYSQMQDDPGVPDSPVFAHETSCGQGEPNATDITHGLSVGWGDTYPSTLPDQAIDISGLPDGNYTVRVKADWKHLFRESDETNNVASIEVEISGDNVRLLSASSGF